MTELSPKNIDLHQLSEQENSSDAILKILNNFINSNQYKLKSKRSNKYVFFNIDEDKSLKYFFPILILIQLLFLALGFLKDLFKTNDVIITIVTLFFHLLAFVLYGLLLIMVVYIITKLRNEAKSAVKNSIYKLYNYDTDSYFQTIELLANKFSKKSLKKLEIRTKVAINQGKSHKNLSSKLIPALSICIVAVGIYLFGVQNFNQTANNFFSTSGIIAILGIGWKIYHESLSQNLLIYEQCILILQEAQNIAEEREKSNKLISGEDINEKYEYLLQELKNIAKEIKTKEKKSSINKNIKGRSLMAGLKKIKTIEAPEDFSTNFDAYMSGDKGAGRDIY